MKMNNIPSGANYELFSERLKTSRVSYADGKFERIESKDGLNNRLRLLSEGKIVTVGSTCPNGADKMMADAVEMLKYGSDYSESFAKAAQIKPLTLFDPKSLSSKEMIDIMNDFVEKLKKLDSRLNIRAELTNKNSEIALKTSMGFDHSYEKSFWEIAAYVALVQGDDRYDMMSYRQSMRPDFDIQAIIDDIAQKLEWGEKVVEFKAGAYPVIFAPSQTTFILNPVLESLNGQAFYDKTSPWVDKLGSKTLDARFSIVDDATIDKSYGSQPFDVEGTPTQRTVLVENGALNAILLDNKYGARLSKPSTGNASAYGVPTPNHIEMSAGSKSVEDMIKSIDYGVIINDTMGAWSGNPFAGIVSGTISAGFKIENGKIAGRIKDCMFTANSFEHLDKHLVDLSSERQVVEEDGYFANLPYMQLDKVVISAE